MTTLTMRSMIAVAALAVAASCASAQTYKAEIPMAFHAGSKTLAAGTYDFVVVTSGSGRQTVAIRSATSYSALLVPVPGADAPKAWQNEGTAKLAFECLGNSCSLSRLYNGRDTSTYEFPSRKLAPAEKERMALVTVGLTRATD
jgi:hypothetical protein